jgi:hypothetical protein
MPCGAERSPNAAAAQASKVLVLDAFNVFLSILVLEFA